MVLLPLEPDAPVQSVKIQKPYKRQGHIRTLSKSDRLRVAKHHRDLKLCGVLLMYFLRDFDLIHF